MTDIRYTPVGGGQTFGDPGQYFRNAADSLNKAFSGAQETVGAFDKIGKDAIAKRTDDAITALKGAQTPEQYNQIASQFSDPTNAQNVLGGEIDFGKIQAASLQQQQAIKDRAITDLDYAAKLSAARDEPLLKQATAALSKLTPEQVAATDPEQLAKQYGITDVSKLVNLRSDFIKNRAQEEKTLFDLGQQKLEQVDIEPMKAVSAAIATAQSESELNRIRQEVSTGKYGLKNTAPALNSINSAIDRIASNELRGRELDAYSDQTSLNKAIGNLTATRDSAIATNMELRNAFVKESNKYIPGVSVDGTGNFRFADSGPDKVSPEDEAFIINKYNTEYKSKEIPVLTDKDQLNQLQKYAQEINATPDQINKFKETLRGIQADRNTLNTEAVNEVAVKEAEFTTSINTEIAKDTEDYQRVLRDNPIDTVVTPEQERIKPGEAISELVNKYPKTVWGDGEGGDNLSKALNAIVGKANYPGWVIKEAGLRAGEESNLFTNGLSVDRFKTIIEDVMRNYTRSQKNKETVDKAKEVLDTRLAGYALDKLKNSSRLLSNAKAKSNVFDTTTTSKSLGN